jgi:hypothetical protein
MMEQQPLHLLLMRYVPQQFPIMIIYQMLVSQGLQRSVKKTLLSSWTFGSAMHLYRRGQDEHWD